MYNPKLEQLNAEISSFVSAAVAKFHDQKVGIKVMDLHTESEALNPPGIKYNIRIGIQITFDTKKETPPVV